MKRREFLKQGCVFSLLGSYLFSQKEESLGSRPKLTSSQRRQLVSMIREQIHGLYSKKTKT
jgi:hypothetical protein